MKVGVLTSSRADYGIYKPLLEKLEADSEISLEIIAYGMHLQHSQGYTYSIIESDGYKKIHTVGRMPESDEVYDIAKGYALILKAFTHFWYSNNFDIVFALGDRWEMSAAVQASIPYQIKIAHIHGGETTLGALDNIYRHQISLASKLHFTATEEFSQRVEQIISSKKGIFTTGSISLVRLENIKLPKWNDVQKQFQIPFKEFVLVTIHSESVLINKNAEYASLSYQFLEKLAQSKNVLITKPNSDALGSLYKKQFELLQAHYPQKIKLVSSLGKLNYFKAMQQCEFMVGNTSSGIIEAASFKKWVINLGERQAGRIRNDNIIDVPFDLDKINHAIANMNKLGAFKGMNKYRKINTCDLILNKIKEGHV
jgi:GDP/UDP-N,N'-diacetylbacillosamine 2-epimerase (hydrolysing)